MMGLLLRQSSFFVKLNFVTRTCCTPKPSSVVNICRGLRSSPEVHYLLNGCLVVNSKVFCFWNFPRLSPAGSADRRLI